MTRKKANNVTTNNPLTLADFADEYSRLLEEFMEEPGEPLLMWANELGKRALDNDIGLLDVAAAHESKLADMIKRTPVRDRQDVIEKTEQVLLECLAGFEMSVRGFWSKLEEARRKSEEDVRAIFASAQDGVLVFDESGSLIDCNRAFAAILGLTMEELKESAGGGRYGPLGGIDEAAIAQLVEKGFFDEYEREFTRGDGRTAVVTISGAMIGAGREGGPWRAFAFVKDITERKRVEEALRRSEEKYRTLYESSIDGIVSVDMEGRIIDANQAYLDMLGYTLDEARKLQYSQLTPEKWHDAEQWIFESELLAHGYSRLYEKEYIRKDGTVFPVSIRRWLVPDEEGRPTGVWSIVRDITEQKRSELDLERKNAELEGFARSVSHDLRAPLSTIVLANETLRDAVNEGNPKVMRDDVREAAKTISRSLARSYALMDDLLALAKSGQQPTELSDVNVAEVVRGIRAEHEREFEVKGVALETSEDLGVVRASETHLYQLFTNLIMNAVQHNDTPEPVVKVLYQGKAADGSHRYIVRDNGPGIPQEDLDKIFTPFFKKGASSHTGVGLAIVHKVTSVYGGSISVHNDDGACFEFTLKDWTE